MAKPCRASWWLLVFSNWSLAGRPGDDTLPKSSHAYVMLSTLVIATTVHDMTRSSRVSYAWVQAKTFDLQVQNSSKSGRLARF